MTPISHSTENDLYLLFHEKIPEVIGKSRIGDHMLNLVGLADGGQFQFPEFARISDDVIIRAFIDDMTGDLRPEDIL